MEATRDIRRTIVEQYLGAETVEREAVESLRNALVTLESIPHEAGTYRVNLTGTRTVGLDLRYEIGELRKDITFLEQGEDGLYEYLTHLHPRFWDYVNAGVARLKGTHFHVFATDRDGTINNYCGRYRSSIQSAYNAVFLARFARACADHSVIVTSAPLSGPGIIDVTTSPADTFIYAASRAREFLDTEAKRHTFRISDEQNQKITDLNERLKELVKQPDFQKFSYIGSGLQCKFGQTTIARQEIGHSIPNDESAAFLKLIQRTVRNLDPEQHFFRIEDTGLDIEITLVIEKPGGKQRDFNKGDGLLFVDRELSLPLSLGPNLICGDNIPDLSMVQVSLDKTSRTAAGFVTESPELRDKVTILCPDSVIVPAVDMLVTIMHKLSQNM